MAGANAGNPVEQYWDVKLEAVKKKLVDNGFTVSMHENEQEAARYVVETLAPEFNSKTVGFGGSKTIADSGVLDLVKNTPGMELMDVRDPSYTREDIYELRRGMLLADLYLSSSNALTMDGKLVNLDMNSNRVAAMHFGPRRVVLMITRNKICETVDDAMTRVKSIAAPTNSMRLNMKNPCVKTGVCMNCNSPDRICAVWTITEKCRPFNRIHVQLINDDGGF